MDALDLTVEDRIRIDYLTRGRLQPVSELRLPFAGGLEETLLEAGIGGERFELAQLAKINNPAVANGLSDSSGEGWIGEQQPPPRRNNRKSTRLNSSH